jgi:hypothetical protein
VRGAAARRMRVREAAWLRRAEWQVSDASEQLDGCVIDKSEAGDHLGRCALGSRNSVRARRRQLLAMRAVVEKRLFLYTCITCSTAR